MLISHLEWDDYRVEHIALHDVEPDEVEQVRHDPLHLAHREGAQSLSSLWANNRRTFLVRRLGTHPGHDVQAYHGPRYDRGREAWLQETAEMSKLQLPEFKTYEDEAAFWDNLDTSDFMEDDGEWFRFETAKKRAVRVAILPEVASELSQRARAQGISVETLVNAWLIEHMHELANAS